jgi:hypothetical protein
MQELNGQQIDAPSWMTPDDLKAALKPNSVQQDKPTSFAPTPPAVTGAPQEHIDHTTLASNSDWLGASRIMFRQTQGVDFTGTNEQLSEWGLSRMSAFNNNMLHMGVDAVSIKQAPTESKKAFLYMLDTFDKVNPSLSGAMRAVGYQLYDPLFLGGLATMGIGAAGSTAIKIASREGLKQALHAGLRAGIETGIGAAVQERVTQEARINADDPNYANGPDYGKVALHGAIGTVGGVVLGGAADMLMTGLRKPVVGAIAKGEAKVVQTEAAQAVAGEAVNAADKAAVKEVANETEKAAAKAVTEADTQGVMAAIRDIAADSGIRQYPRTYPDIQTFTEKVVETLTKLKGETAGGVMETLARLAKTDEERDILVKSLPQARAALAEENRVSKAAVDAMTDPTTKKVAQDALDRSEKLYEAIADLDQRVASIQASGLGYRNAPENTMTGEAFRLSQENIATEQGIVLAKATPAEREAVRTEFYRRYEEIMEGRVVDQEIVKLRGEFAQAQKANDLPKMIEIQGKINKIAEDKAEKRVATDTIGGALYKKVGGAIDTSVRALAEYVTAVVLGPSSIIANTMLTGAKVLYTPALNYLAKGPFEKAYAREMLAAYGAMGSIAPHAFKAAIESFKLEKSLLSGTAGSWLNNSPAIGGKTGGAIRIWLRTLSATDEFFQQIAYKGVVTGMATAEGIEKGLSKADLAKYVEEFTAKAYSTSGIDITTIAMLRKEAVRKGIAVDAVDQWVQHRLTTQPDLYKKALNEAGKDISDDLLFKRSFSAEGKGMAGLVSKSAAAYEKMAINHPMFKLMGQLFFKTPVRVFEEGIRLTPGMNLLAPRFIDDLLGKNGDARRVRALGESMVAYGIGASVINAYAQGHITGAGDSNYRQRRGMEDSKDFKPYSYRTADGTFVSFRNFDPIATPVKIMVNALEKIHDLEYRRAQGELRNETEWQKAVQWFGVGLTAAAGAVKDANLTDGVSQLIDFGSALTDPIDKEKALQRFAGQKAAQLIPNVFSKGERAFGDGMNVMSDPVAIEQYWKQKINPADPTVSRQFDALGYERRNDAVGVSAFLGFEVSTKEQRQMGYSKEALVVKKYMEMARQATDATFMPTFKSSMNPGVDLREVLTADGAETYYNRIFEMYHKSSVEKDLYKLVKRYEDSRNTPIFGTPSKDGIDNHGPTTKSMQKIIDIHWKAAEQKVLLADREAVKRKLEAQNYKRESISGKREMFPFNQ